MLLADAGLPGTISLLEPTGPETYVLVDTPIGKMMARVPGKVHQAGRRERAPALVGRTTRTCSTPRPSAASPEVRPGSTGFKAECGRGPAYTEAQPPAVPRAAMFDALDTLTQRVAPADARWTLRARAASVSETLTVRQDVAEAPQRSRDAGVMVSVAERRRPRPCRPRRTSAKPACADAFARARAHGAGGRRPHGLRPGRAARACTARGRYDGVVQRPVQPTAPARAAAQLLRRGLRRRASDPRIVDWAASLLSIADRAAAADQRRRAAASSAGARPCRTCRPPRTSTA